MKKGSPRDYDAETGCFEQPAQKSQLGEPHDCYPLYRIGRTQENHQLLHKDGRRPDRSGGQIAGHTVSASQLGGRPTGAVVWGDGSHAVRRLDLRHLEALRAAAGDGSSSEDEGHHCRQKEERYDRCTDHRGLLRCDLLPTCYVLPEMRDLRRLLRYRNMVVQQSVRMQNKMAGLLMESGTTFVKTKLHGKKYFSELMKSLEEVPESVKDLLRMSRGSMEMFESTQKQIAKRLLSEHALQQRVERLLSSRGVGPITALTWALEVSDPHRFSSIGDAVSYCGLTAAFRSSAGKEQRGPISKQRNAWLQTVLIEAAKVAPRWNPQLATLHARQLELGHPNRATLQVARKLVAYLLAVDKSGQSFQVLTPPPTPENATKTKRRKRASMAKAA
jgi:hypothetical protein